MTIITCVLILQYILFVFIVQIEYNKFKKYSEIRLGDFCFIVACFIPLIGVLFCGLGVVTYIENNKYKVIFKLKGK